jgi:GMP synthase-like glutamine amidotransferase
VAESRVLVVQNDASDPIGPLGDWLTDAGLVLDLCDASAGARVPSTLDGYAGLVVLGGSQGALEDDRAPWQPAVRRLLADAVAHEVPILGVCLGAQLLAVATGGRVGPNPDGPEFGAQLIAKRVPAATDPLFGPMPITPDVIQWHFDAILALPAGAVLLASSPVCEVQAFRLGRVAWGLQCHIETTPDLVRLWAEEDADALDGYDVERILARSDAAHTDIAEAWAPFAARWAEVVRDPSTVMLAAGAAVSTAEPVTDPAQIRAALAMEATSARAVPLDMPSFRPPSREP